MNKIDLCKAIQMNVSKLTESENLELFKIILDTKANYTRNNNGIFLNLNWIEEELLVKINNYILFCMKSQNEISKYELMKTLLNDSINTRELATDDDMTDANASTAASDDANAVKIANAANVAGVEADTIATPTSDVVGDANVANTESIPVSVVPKQKFSSSMKFYLLKKKFMKQNTNYATCLDNDLTYEDYLIT
jgi:hypothetical protein